MQHEKNGKNSNTEITQSGCTQFSTQHIYANNANETTAVWRCGFVWRFILQLYSIYFNYHSIEIDDSFSFAGEMCLVFSFVLSTILFFTWQLCILFRIFSCVIRSVCLEKERERDRVRALLPRYMSNVHCKCNCHNLIIAQIWSFLAFVREYKGNSISRLTMHNLFANCFFFFICQPEIIYHCLTCFCWISVSRRTLNFWPYDMVVDIGFELWDKDMFDLKTKSSFCWFRKSMLVWNSVDLTSQPFNCSCICMVELFIFQKKSIDAYHWAAAVGFLPLHFNKMAFCIK